jgi:hypothetical protein
MILEKVLIPKTIPSVQVFCYGGIMAIEHRLMKVQLLVL